MGDQTFKPSSELTFDTVQKDSEQLIKFLRDNHETEVHLNLHQVTLCDSAGLALLIEAKRLCKQYNKRLVIEGMPKAIYALAEFCGVEAMLEQGDVKQ